MRRVPKEIIIISKILDQILDGSRVHVQTATVTLSEIFDETQSRFRLIDLGL